MKTNPFYIAAIALLVSAPLAYSQDIDFGNDSGDFPSDGECDDPRFTGKGMAVSLSEESILKDASDCSALFAAQRIRLVRTREESDISECASIDFGDNSSEWARDNECDDPRFAGDAVDDILNPEDLKTDAADCKALCEAGRVWLR